MGEATSASPSWYSSLLLAEFDGMISPVLAGSTSAPRPAPGIVGNMSRFVTDPPTGRRVGADGTAGSAFTYMPLVIVAPTCGEEMFTAPAGGSAVIVVPPS